MPRPLLAVALVAAALAGCKKPGPAEPSEADAKEAYVAYKRLAAESRAASGALRKAAALETEFVDLGSSPKMPEVDKQQQEARQQARALVEKSGAEFKSINDKARAMEHIWEKRWARLGLSLEPLTASTAP